jgi:SAM-dependent methyltransferase
VEPYLDGAVRDAYDAWIEAGVARFIPPLTFSEVRKGAVALSSLYVERRAEGRLASRALEGHGKRAAFATYYAGLHFLIAWHATALLGEEIAEVRRVIDLGCGTGAVGAAVARACDARVQGLDRSGWALGEARRTYAAFGLSARTRRASLPAGLPRDAGPGDLLAAGWVTNELNDDARERFLDALLEARRRGAHLLLIEPLAGAASPWWKDQAPRFQAEGAAARPLKKNLVLPAWIARMDKAAGLNHRPLGARIIVA